LIGKRTNPRYEAGKRTGAWVKIKLHKEQEFVIGGYTEPEPGSVKSFCVRSMLICKIRAPSASLRVSRDRIMGVASSLGPFGNESLN